MKKLRQILFRLLTTRVAWPIAITIGLLSAASIFALQLSSPERAERQKLFILVGSVVLFLAVLPRFQSFGRFAYLLFACTIVLLLTVLRGEASMGARRWIDLGAGYQLQPSELAKIAFVLTVSWYLRYRRNVRQLSGLLVPFLLMLVPFGLILVEPDLGTALLFPPALYAMLITAGARLRHLFTIALIIVLAAPGAYPLLKPYQQERLRAVARHWMGVGDMSFHTARSLEAIGSGGVSGQGNQGARYIRQGALPAAYTDFIFSVVGVQWGFRGCVLILVLYLAFFAASMEIAGSTKDQFGRVMVVGLATMILFQALINIAMTIALAPVVGITLPFVSYGGSSLLTNMLAVGLLLNVSVRRQGQSSGMVPYA